MLEFSNLVQMLPPSINREREGSSITYAHVLNCRVLVLKYSVYAPNYIKLVEKCSVNTSCCIVLEVECSV